MCVFVLISVALGYLGYSANKEIEKTVTGQFNRQQLILAKKIAHAIRNHFDFLETNLAEYNRSWERNAKSAAELRAHGASLFSLLKDWHVLAIVHVDRKGRIPFIFSEQGVTDGSGLGINCDDYRQWAVKPEHRGKIIIGPTLRPESGLFKGRWVMVMATATYKPEARPKDGPYFDGLTCMVIDPVGIAMRYARDVRSGKTGYAWVIDHRGVFLSHYEDTFIGEDSFTVRHRRNPRISYAQINEAVRDHLLKGEEGEGWYISGWHRGVISEMKKLFAYTPIFLSKEDAISNLWSVALVAPVAEVYGIVQSLVVRQWLIVGLVQGLVFICLAVAIYFSLRWSRILQAEVDNKTADLRRSESEVRQERDKVKESMRQLIEMQGQLVRSERFAAMGEAAAYLSHEIKNPLMVMGGFAGQVEKSLPEEDANRRKLRIIQDEALRLESMLTEVRDFTRPSKPKKELQDINPVVENTLNLLESDLRDKGIRCQKSLSSDLPSLFLDPQQIKQVLINLVKNALEAMPHGGHLDLSSWREGGYVKILIADSGMGMPPEVAQKLFEPFFTTKKKGTGLGLAVSRKIIEDHGGDISVQTKVGEGTRVTIALPIKTEEASTAGV